MADLGKLGQIVEAKREEVGRRFGSTPIEQLRAGAVRTERSLAKAMARPGARFIFEFKRSSPSEGALRVDADPATIARSYSGAADAMSVLTDRQFFGGSLDDLKEVRAHFDGPILAKDFVVDPRQLVEARIAGADAALAIMAVLDDDEVRGLFAEAERWGMDILTEVHDEAEMRRALAIGAPMIGINNRDLKSFKTDLSTTERLAPMAGAGILISESGILTRNDVERLSPLVDGFLIGSSVMRADDPREAARALAFGRVKLCGLRTADDLRAARSATHAGMVFVPGTPRAVTVDEAEAAISCADGHPPLVGVFRDASLDTVLEAAKRLRLAAVQLHGAEDAEFIDALRQRFDGEVWLAESDGNQRTGGDRVVFDNGDGGTGSPFDWSTVQNRKELGGGLIAGGIGIANVRSAQRLGAHALDIGSAMDETPGVKSAAKIDALFEALRPDSRTERRGQCA